MHWSIYPCLAAAVTLVGACATVPPRDPVECSQGACVMLGQAQQLREFTVTPIEVLDDSRCPEGVQCVWEGEVRMRVAIASTNGVAEDEISTRSPVPVNRGMLQLAEVTPAPSADSAFDPGAYRFRFRWVPDIAQ